MGLLHLSTHIFPKTGKIFSYYFIAEVFRIFSLFFTFLKPAILNICSLSGMWNILKAIFSFFGLWCYKRFVYMFSFFLFIWCSLWLKLSLFFCLIKFFISKTFVWFFFKIFISLCWISYSYHELFSYFH